MNPTAPETAHAPFVNWPDPASCISPANRPRDTVLCRLGDGRLWPIRSAAPLTKPVFGRIKGVDYDTFVGWEVKPGFPAGLARHVAAFNSAEGDRRYPAVLSLALALFRAACDVDDDHAAALFSLTEDQGVTVIQAVQRAINGGPKLPAEGVRPGDNPGLRALVELGALDIPDLVASEPATPPKDYGLVIRAERAGPVDPGYLATPRGEELSRMAARPEPDHEPAGEGPEPNDPRGEPGSRIWAGMVEAVREEGESTEAADARFRALLDRADECRPPSPAPAVDDDQADDETPEPPPMRLLVPGLYR